MHVRSRFGRLRSVRSVGHPPAHYAGVLDGQTLWCSVTIGPGDSWLALRGRRDARLVELPSSVRADGSGRWVEVTVDLVESIPAEAEVWDVVLCRPSRAPVRVRVTREVLAPSGGRPGRSGDGWTRRVYRTRDGFLALSVAPRPVNADLARLVCGPGLIRAVVRLSPVTGETPDLEVKPAPAVATIRRRSDGAEQAVMVGQAEDGFELDLLPRGLVAESDDTCARTETWDVRFGAGDEARRVGRTDHDLSNLRQAVRYPTVWHAESSESSSGVKVRPYFTNDLHLALEVTQVWPVVADEMMDPE